MTIPDTELKNVFDVQMCLKDRYLCIENIVFKANFDTTIEKLAKNDGLTVEDFYSWFGNKFFDGQILCWDEKIQYL